MVKLPLFDPLDGDTVSQDAALLLTDHDTFEVTDTLAADEADPGLQEEPLSVSEAEEAPPVTVTE